MSFPSPDRQPLARTDLDPDPIKQFGAWFEAAAEIVALPEAMTLATVDEAGRPDARMVLLKGHGADGFRFFTNYEGVKAAQLDASGEAALVFFWAPQDRQVRVRGPVRRLDADASDRYFASRDRASQVGAWASPRASRFPTRGRRSKSWPKRRPIVSRKVKYRDPRIGEVSSWSPARSSSGRVAGPGSTTVFATTARLRERAGRSPAWLPERNGSGSFAVTGCMTSRRGLDNLPRTCLACKPQG